MIQSVFEMHSPLHRDRETNLRSSFTIIIDFYTFLFMVERMGKHLSLSSALLPIPQSSFVDATTTVGSAIVSLDTNTDCLLVMEDDHYVGVLTASHLFFQSRYPRTAKAKHAAIHTRVLYPETEIWEAAEEMVEKRTYTLPVFDAMGQVMGIVTAKSILQALSDYPEIVADICTKIEFRKPITAPIDSSVGTVYKLMRNQNVSRVVLIDEEEKLAGIVSRSDLRDSFAKPPPRDRFRSKNGEAHDFLYDEEQVRRLDAPIRNFATINVFSQSDTKDCDDIVPLLITTKSTSVVLVDQQRKPTRFLSTRDLLDAYTKVAKQESPIPIRITKPRKDMQVEQVNLLEELVYSHVEKLHQRHPVMEAQVSFKEAVSPVKNMRNVESKVIITFQNGDQLIGEGNERQELPSVRAALKKIEKQERRKSYD